MKNLSLIAVCVILMTACQQGDEIVSPSGAPRIDQRSNQARPFHATLSGSLNFNSPPTACTGDAPFALLDYHVAGSATHMGQLNATSFLHHDDCNLSISQFLLTTGVSGELVAANGDKVYYSGDDAIDVFNYLTGEGLNGPITGDWTITGGTGRFTDASGTLEMSGVVDFVTLGFTATATGTITY